MREIINISLPSSMAKLLKKEVREGQYASTSEFIRHLIREHNTNKLAQALHRDRKSFEKGKGNKLNSLKDLM